MTAILAPGIAVSIPKKQLPKESEKPEEAEKTEKPEKGSKK